MTTFDIEARRRKKNTIRQQTWNGFIRFHVTCDEPFVEKAKGKTNCFINKKKKYLLKEYEGNKETHHYVMVSHQRSQRRTAGFCMAVDFPRAATSNRTCCTKKREMANEMSNERSSTFSHHRVRRTKTLYIYQRQDEWKDLASHLVSESRKGGWEIFRRKRQKRKTNNDEWRWARKGKKRER